MTTHDKTLLRRYFRQIAAWLPCRGQQKSQIISSVKNDVSAFLSDNPNAAFFQVEQRFGSPREIAAACVEDMDMPDLLKAMRSRRRILTAVVAGVIAVLLVWAIGVSIAVIEQRNYNPDHMEAPSELFSSVYRPIICPEDMREMFVTLSLERLCIATPISVRPRTVTVEDDGTFKETTSKTKTCYAEDDSVLWEMTVVVTQHHDWSGIIGIEVSGTVSVAEGSGWYVLCEDTTSDDANAVYSVTLGRKTLGITTFTETQVLSVAIDKETIQQ